jgi:hypothetical protein
MEKRLSHVSGTRKTFAGEENLAAVIAILNMPNLPESFKPLFGVILDCLSLGFAANQLELLRTSDNTEAFIQAFNAFRALNLKVNDSLKQFQWTPYIEGVLIPERVRLEWGWHFPIEVDDADRDVAIMLDGIFGALLRAMNDGTLGKIKACERCGDLFYQRKANKRFCGRRCQISTWAKTEKGKAAKCAASKAYYGRQHKSWRKP